LEKGLNVSSPYALNRRQLLRVTGAGIVSVGVGSTLGVAGAAPAHAAPAQFSGHKPGKIYLGLSNGGQSLASTVNRTGALGLRRTYYGWDNLKGELKNIKADHAAGRLPWISFKPASVGKGGWAAIAKGNHDAALRARARAYDGLSKPVIVTFNHEPHNDKTGTPAEFAKAWCRVHDIMKDETGLRNVISAPIIGEWVYNPTNRKQDPEEFITGPLLDRCHMLGVDLYQNETGQDYSVRLGRVVDWLDARGHRQMPVGLGETACSMDFSRPNGVDWWKSSWKWAVASGRVAAISYYNSSRNNTLKKDWVLWETSAKLQAYKDSLKSAASVRL
jgi:hypothetical protein